MSILCVRVDLWTKPKVTKVYLGNKRLPPPVAAFRLRPHLWVGTCLKLKIKADGS